MRSAVWLLVVTSAVYADKVFSDVSSPGMRKKAMSVPSASFNESCIERLARVEFAKKPRANFTWLRIYGDKGGAPLPKPPDGITHDYWHRLYDLAAKTPNEAAEMILIGDSAVLRMRDASGKVTRKVPTAKDPLIIPVENDQLEIVYIAFSPPGRRA